MKVSHNIYGLGAYSFLKISIAVSFWPRYLYSANHWGLFAHMANLKLTQKKMAKGIFWKG